MTKFYFNNVQNEWHWKERETARLLQVVKWFTKCLFYSLLLKICIGLLSLFSSFVLEMFCKCFLLPRGRHLSPNASNSRSDGSCLCLEAKNRCTQNKVWLDFFFLSPSLRWAHQWVNSSFEKWAKKFTFFTTGKHLIEDRYISPVVHLSPWVASGSLLCRAALSPHVKQLLFLHEYFSSSHRNKKPYYTMACM